MKSRSLTNAALLFGLCVACILVPHVLALFQTLLGFSIAVPVIAPPVALALGLVFATLVELPLFGGAHPFKAQSSKVTKWLLQASVVGLGFGLNIQSVIEAGTQGFWFTLATIVGTLAVGLTLGNVLGVRKAASQLITVGTAICGGSAIAALAPAINADDADVSVSLGIVFVLNALALFIFPASGTALGLTEQQFGIWSAIAIHDTSSVVGAASRFGDLALSTATTIKLSRALWIIPLSFGFAYAYAREQARLRRDRYDSAKSTQAPFNITIPYSIFLFLAASLLRTFVPGVVNIAPFLVSLAKIGLTLTLFLIGSGLSRQTLKTVGIRPFVQGIVLWLAISLTTLWFVIRFV